MQSYQNNERSSLLNKKSTLDSPTKGRNTGNIHITGFGVVGGILVGIAIGCLLMSRGSSQWFSSAQTNNQFPTSKYNKVQGIGFQIYTGGAPAFLSNNNKGPRNPECIGLNSYGEFYDENGLQYQCYLGLEDPIDDVRVRIKLMKEAI